MPQVQSIRRLRRNGESVASIARKTHVSEPTVRKYLAKEDLSAVPSVRKPRASVIDPYLPVIEQWLAEDRANWRKQRHTATRIWERLRDEHGAEVSLSTVTRAVARLRREFAAERDEAFMDLVWHPGEAQADFGEVDVLLRGVVQRMHHFVLDFPYSNVGLVQLMPGENAECTWGGPKDIAPYIDPVFDNNILLTQTERLTMNNRPKDPKTARNKNVLVIGGSGSGKTRFFVKPNLMQCVSKDYPTSFVITDPKGSLIGEVGQLLVRCGYRVKVLNTINFSKSMRYNPFRYIHSEKDILKLVNTLICNTKGEGEKSAEDFWIKSERLLYSALIGYIWYEAPDDEMNFTTLLEMINASEAREDDPEFQSPVDQMFERLEEKDPEHFAVRQYRKFLLSAGKTRSSILISCGARLAPFDIREVRELMEDDELELDTIGDKKTALFLIMSDTDTTFNFILAMVQSQLINLLCDRADDKYGGRLPVHVRLILDEFANIGQIPNFDKLIATIRSREISASIILQSQSQLKAIYKDAAEIISDNCDCTLFLSGRGKNAKEIAEVLGKETIDSYNQSENRGAQTSHGLNYQKLGKELMSQDEIATMDGGKCILQVRGVRPFFSEKYDITRHPRYKYLSDADKKNTFDVDSYLSSLRRKRRRVITEDEPFDLYDIELSEEDFSAE